MASRAGKPPLPQKQATPSKPPKDKKPREEWKIVGLDLKENELPTESNLQMRTILFARVFNDKGATTQERFRTNVAAILAAYDFFFRFSNAEDFWARLRLAVSKLYSPHFMELVVLGYINARRRHLLKTNGKPNIGKGLDLVITNLLDHLIKRIPRDEGPQAKWTNAEFQDRCRQWTQAAQDLDNLLMPFRQPVKRSPSPVLDTPLPEIQQLHAQVSPKAASLPDTGGWASKWQSRNPTGAFLNQPQISVNQAATTIPEHATQKPTLGRPVSTQWASPLGIQAKFGQPSDLPQPSHGDEQPGTKENNGERRLGTGSLSSAERVTVGSSHQESLPRSTNKRKAPTDAEHSVTKRHAVDLSHTMSPSSESIPTVSPTMEQLSPRTTRETSPHNDHGKAQPVEDDSTSGDTTKTKNENCMQNRPNSPAERGRPKDLSSPQGQAVDVAASALMASPRSQDSMQTFLDIPELQRLLEILPAQARKLEPVRNRLKSVNDALSISRQEASTMSQAITRLEKEKDELAKRLQAAESKLADSSAASKSPAAPVVQLVNGADSFDELQIKQYLARRDYKSLLGHVAVGLPKLAVPLVHGLKQEAGDEHSAAWKALEHAWIALDWAEKQAKISATSL